jgi:hypothetical protein
MACSRTYGELWSLGSEVSTCHLQTCQTAKMLCLCYSVGTLVPVTNDSVYRALVTSTYNNDNDENRCSLELKYHYYYILSNFLLITMKAVPRIGILTIRSIISIRLVLNTPVGC